MAVHFCPSHPCPICNPQINTQPPWPSVYVLAPEDFDRVLADLESPSPPTESIKRGAELLRKLYPRT